MVRRFIAALDGRIYSPAVNRVELHSIRFSENGEMNFVSQGGGESPHPMSEHLVDFRLRSALNGLS